MTTPWIAWIALTFLIFSFVRILQYQKEEGVLFCLAHSILDAVALWNPMNLVVIPIYLVLKYFYFKKIDKKIGWGFPYVDILLFVICMILFSTVLQLYIRYLL